MEFVRVDVDVDVDERLEEEDRDEGVLAKEGDLFFVVVIDKEDSPTDLLQI